MPNLKIKYGTRPKTTIMLKQKRLSVSITEINRLSKPKYKEITEDDLSNKGKFYYSNHIGFNTRDLLRKTRADIEEHVQDALATNQKIPMLENIKFDNAPKVAKTKGLNKLRAQKYFKEQELKRLKDYSNQLQKIIETEIPNDSYELTKVAKKVNSSSSKLESEIVETEVLDHIFTRDKMSFLFKTKTHQTLETNIGILRNSIMNIRNKTAELKNEKKNLENEKLSVQDIIMNQNDIMGKNINAYLKDFKEINLLSKYLKLL
jgi:hypothetical protein